MKKKKPFKLNVMGLFNMECEDYTVIQTALLLTLIMAFVMGIIIVLKVYAVPLLGVPMAGNRIMSLIEKIRKPRAP